MELQIYWQLHITCSLSSLSPLLFVMYGGWVVVLFMLSKQFLPMDSSKKKKKRWHGQMNLMSVRTECYVIITSYNYSNYVS